LNGCDVSWFFPFAREGLKTLFYVAPKLAWAIRARKDGSSLRSCKIAGGCNVKPAGGVFQAEDMAMKLSSCIAILGLMAAMPCLAQAAADNSTVSSTAKSRQGAAQSNGSGQPIRQSGSNTYGNHIVANAGRSASSTMKEHAKGQKDSSGPTVTNHAKPQ
jgi:hypothetical protein